MEQERQKHEFSWEKANLLAVKRLSKVCGLNKSVGVLVDEINLIKSMTYNEKEVLPDETPIKFHIHKNTEVFEGTVGELSDFLTKSNTDESVCLPIHHISVIGMVENPFLHPLAKSLNIGRLDEEFVKSNQILTKEVYDTLSKGETYEGETGYLNIDINEAHEEFTDFKSVRKLVYDGGKANVITLYTRPL